MLFNVPDIEDTVREKLDGIEKKHANSQIYDPEAVSDYTQLFRNVLSQQGMTDLVTMARSAEHVPGENMDAKIFRMVARVLLEEIGRFANVEKLLNTPPSGQDRGVA